MDSKGNKSVSQRNFLFRLLERKLFPLALKQNLFRKEMNKNVERSEKFLGRLYSESKTYR